MPPISYARHRFPPMVVRHAVWLYLHVTLSFRDVEDLLAERGLEVSYGTVRRWVLNFEPAIARRLRQRRPKPSARWYLDEMAVRITALGGTCGGRCTTRARTLTSCCGAGGERRQRAS